MTLWQHLFPPFDAWWPNIMAQVVWTGPVLTVHHVLLKRHFRNEFAEHLRAVVEGE
jgi:hypothetical protein